MGIYAARGVAKSVCEDYAIVLLDKAPQCIHEEPKLGNQCTQCREVHVQIFQDTGTFVLIMGDKLKFTKKSANGQKISLPAPGQVVLLSIMYSDGEMQVTQWIKEYYLLKFQAEIKEHKLAVEQKIAYEGYLEEQLALYLQDRLGEVAEDHPVLDVFSFMGSKQATAEGWVYQRTLSVAKFKLPKEPAPGTTYMAMSYDGNGQELDQGKVAIWMKVEWQVPYILQGLKPIWEVLRQLGYARSRPLSSSVAAISPPSGWSKKQMKGMSNVYQILDEEKVERMRIYVEIKGGKPQGYVIFYKLAEDSSSAAA